MIANSEDKDVEAIRTGLIRCISELCPLVDDKTLCSIANYILSVTE
jgi:hypothetical protein